MSKLTKEQQELLNTWPKLLYKQCEDLIDGSNVMIADINIFVKALLEAKDAEKADAVEKEQEKLEEAKDVIKELAMQYGLELPGPLLHSGAISAMEYAFEFLGWADPYPIPERKCEVGTCIQPATCGKLTSDGYKKLCREHESFFNQKEL